MDTSKYFKLCIRDISGHITPEEKDTLYKWLRRSSENQDYYNQLSDTWAQQKFPELPFKPDTDKAWFHFEKSLVETKTKKWPPLLFVNIGDKLEGFLDPIVRPALVTCATLLIFSIGFLFWKSKLFNSPYTSVITRNKQTIELTLSDGSHVRLNNGSSIKYLRTFSDTHRQVMLAGEAFFKVTRDERPFTVVTKQAWTTVLGTQFNVWARGEETLVIVKEGRVRLSSIIPDSGSFELTKGQMSQIVGQHSPEPPELVDAEYLLGWLNGRLIFKKTPLPEIVAELERTYDVSIVLHNSTLADLTMTAEFENASIEEILSSICLTLNISYTYDSDNYILTNQK